MNTTTERDDAENRRELARDIADRAISRWKEAVAEEAEARRLAGDDGDLGPWARLMALAEVDAARALIRAILAYDPAPDGHRRAPRGLRSCGKIYIATPVEDGDGEGEGPGGADAMTLVVVEESAIVDVEAGGYLAREA